jgi:hypothetical protein
MGARHPGGVADGRDRIVGIVRLLDEAREDLLGYKPPWLEPGFEDLRIEADRKIRNAVLAIMILADEVGTAKTDPPPEGRPS